MHCADQDYRIFNILPPYNVIGAQVILRGQEPELLSPADGVELSYYAVAANIVDPNDDNAPPSATDSINSTSQNPPRSTKAILAFRQRHPNGFLAYNPLYPPGVLGSSR